MFSDVPCSFWAAGWINELARRGITTGCGGGNYCPTNPVHRGEMAAFISRTWSYSTPVPTSTRRHFLYDGAMHLIAESELTSAFEPAVAYEYLWLGDRPVAEEDIGAAQTTWAVTDHLGTPFMQTFASGATAWRVEYEPYGHVYSLRSGADRHQPLRLPGQEAEQLNLGLNGATEKSYNIFRWYRGKWGRYSQADPVKTVGLMASRDSLRTASLHDDAYGGGNPLTFVDPLGLCKACDECQSGKWSYNGFPAKGVVAFKGVTRSNGTFRCIGNPDIGLSVTVSCEVSGPIVGAGWGFETSPFKAGCGCNRKDLLGTSSGTVVSVSVFSVSRTTSTTDPDCSSWTYGVAKSVGGGMGKIQCVVERRARSWWEPNPPWR